MNTDAIKQLEKELWDAADALRANSKLTAAEYKAPTIGAFFIDFQLFIRLIHLNI
jgi:type I restriction enzyme M protein